MKAVNIRMVAKEAGTSISSVSRYLNDAPGVSPSVRKKIGEAIRKLDYRFHSPEKHQIAVILPALTAAVFGEYSIQLIGALRSAIARRGYPCILLSRDDCWILNENSICGVLSLDYLNEMRLEFPNMKNIPLVCLNDRGNWLENVYSVQTDEEKGIDEAVEFLFLRHHRRIALLVCREKNKILCTEKREEAFRRKSRELGIENSCMIQTHDKELSIVEAISITLEKQCTGVIVAGEDFEAEALHALAMFGKRIPEDISVITYETIDSCQRTPRQTTIGQNFHSLAEESLQLLEQIAAGEESLHDIRIPPIFTIRESVRDLPTPLS